MTDEIHRLLALWAADCAEHVLHLFAEACPDDSRPRQAIEAARTWARCDMTVTQCKDAAGASQDAARKMKNISEAARLSALSAGQAAVVAHVAAHELGAAAYAIRAAMEAAQKDEKVAAGQLECLWQRERLPEAIRQLVLDDQRKRNDICWHVFHFEEHEQEAE